MRVELGGIAPGNPLSPYPKLGGIVSKARSPRLMEATPMSQPDITCPTPRVKLNGEFLSRDESNFFPSVNFFFRFFFFESFYLYIIIII